MQSPKLSPSHHGILAYTIYSFGTTKLSHISSAEFLHYVSQESKVFILPIVFTIEIVYEILFLHMHFVFGPEDFY